MSNAITAPARSWQVEFPDFPPADMPAVPAGFIDSSWHNEACPSFTHEGLGLSLFTDWADPAEREWPESYRFSLHRMQWAPVETINGHTIPAGWRIADELAILAFSDDFDAILTAAAVFAFADALAVCVALSHLAQWEAEDLRAERPCPDLLGWVAACRDALGKPGRTSLAEVEQFADHFAQLAAEAAALDAGAA